MPQDPTPAGPLGWMMSSCTRPSSLTPILRLQCFKQPAWWNCTYSCKGFTIRIIPKSKPKEIGEEDKRECCCGCLLPLPAAESSDRKTKKRLCEACILLALVSNNGIEPRYKDELMKAQNTTEKQAKKRKIKEYVKEHNPNLGCAKYIPVDEEVTNEEVWRRAFKDLNMNPNEITKETREEAIQKIKEKELGRRSIQMDPSKAAPINNTRRRHVDINKQGAKRSTDKKRQAEQSTTTFLMDSLEEDTIAGGITLSADNDLKTLEKGRDMNDNCLEAVLRTIARQYSSAKVVSPHYFNRGRTLGFKQVESYIPKDADILIIPIHTGGNTTNRHWSVVLRIRDRLVAIHRLIFIY